jgi:lipopolysaccharide transport system ATP-binding protein
MNLVKNLFKTSQNSEENHIWALKDVSFEIQPGEVVGVIGRNGAGKSTLLKVLAHITSPTEGKVEIRGRIGSLLEVGTGFHPELTGRENIFLNGAVLGMKRTEILRKFDEIVAFAEIEKFLDTPVKHYSSGMYMRLAFAVAAHLEPEILLVDEVLAVGDAAFQKKCMGKMGEVAKEGRTVLFVSHNMAAIAVLCNRSILFDRGSILASGETPQVINMYQSGFIESSFMSFENAIHYGNGKARFLSLKTLPLDSLGNVVPIYKPGNDILIETKVQASKLINDANLTIIIYDMNGYRLVDANTALKGQNINMLPEEKITIKFIMKNVLLKPDKYLIGLWMGRRDIEDIDGITYAQSFNMDIDPEITASDQIFPGVYQCNYVLEIDKTIS